MTISLAFDVYGTMIDTSGVVTVIRRIIGERAEPAEIVTELLKMG